MITPPGGFSPAQAALAQQPPRPAEEAARALGSQDSSSRLAQAGPQAVASTSVPHAATADEFKRASEELQRRIQVTAPELQFTVDHDSGRTLIKVTDPATNEVIRQIPSEEVLQINKGLDRFQGLLLNQKA
ncbi:MAG: flagellar protein FlaG [Betaproteobacteria bacterium]|nr:flagellar protein FlaG [Betaproteobacteria bacterium]